MKIIPRSLLVALTGLGLLSAISIQAQAPDVKLVKVPGDFQEEMETLNDLRSTVRLLTIEDVNAQMARKSCELKLPRPSSNKLTERDIWQRAKESHVQVGWYHLRTNSNIWHQNLEGGYFITEDGAVATCYHVVKPGANFREGYLVAANEAGEMFAVTEVLAANEQADIAIIRVKMKTPVKPLALNTNTYPGDDAWCYSDPLGRSSYFGKGMVNRFFELPGTNGGTSVRIDVSTKWGGGSSGSALLDECGNAIGHASEVDCAGENQNRTRAPGEYGQTPSNIVFYYAARAADILALVKPAK